jgi:hypothetical protein
MVKLALSGGSEFFDRSTPAGMSVVLPESWSITACEIGKYFPSVFCSIGKLIPSSFANYDAVCFLLHFDKIAFH